MSSNDQALAELLWFHDLSDADKFIELKKDNNLCTIVSLFEKEMPEDCIKLCNEVWAFRRL